MITAKEYAYLEKRWQEVYRKLSEVRKKEKELVKEKERIERKLREPIGEE